MPRHKNGLLMSSVTARLTIGLRAQYASYMKKNTTPPSPTISGAKTCAELHANWTPPQVSPTTMEVVEAMIRRFPLLGGPGEEGHPV